MAHLNSGIDFSLPGNGGPECLAFHSTGRRIFVTSLASGLCLLAFYVGLRRHTSPICGRTNLTKNWNRFNQFLDWLCIAMTVVYLLEVGYKFYTLQAIFSINPCHCICLIHIYLILAPKFSDGLASTYVFRIHLFFLHGPFMAVIFPVTNTLFLQGEVAVYWMEHFLLLTIPFALLRVYTVPKYSFSEWLNWGLMAYGIWGMFHFFFLLPIAMWTQANLNSMICPAISDPFRGPNYLLHAVWHQFVVNMISGFIFFSFGIREPGDHGTRNGNKINGISETKPKLND